MVSLPTPITTTFPPRRAVYAAVQTLLSTPVHSSTVSGASYCRLPKSDRIAFALPCASRSRLTWYGIHLGTKLFANASRPASRSVTTIGCAPEARAAASVISPIGPAPHTTAPRPRLSWAILMPLMATDRGSKRAPSAKVILSGSLYSININIWRRTGAQGDKAQLTCVAILQGAPCIVVLFHH
jgi:hypothetical protein